MESRATAPRNKTLSFTGTLSIDFIRGGGAARQAVPHPHLALIWQASTLLAGASVAALCPLFRLYLLVKVRHHLLLDLWR
jgi:hypothetical protein